MHLTNNTNKQNRNVINKLTIIDYKKSFEQTGGIWGLF